MKLVELKDPQTGATLLEMVGPATALDPDADLLSQSLYVLSETLIRGLFPDQRGFGLEGQFGYGASYENEVFSMRPDFGDDDTSPNFLHKPSGLQVRWYKWIGRSTELARHGASIPDGELTVEIWSQIYNECYESIPLAARNNATEERERERKARQLRSPSKPSNPCTSPPLKPAA